MSEVSPQPASLFAGPKTLGDAPTGDALTPRPRSSRNNSTKCHSEGARERRIPSRHGAEVLPKDFIRKPGAVLGWDSPLGCFATLSMTAYGTAC
jgi:hypothetical protein